MIIESLWNKAKFSMLSGNLEEMRELLNHALVLTDELGNSQLVLNSYSSNDEKINNVLEAKTSFKTTHSIIIKKDFLNSQKVFLNTKEQTLYDISELKLKVEV